jgi:hypothetical protein
VTSTTTQPITSKIPVNTQGIQAIIPTLIRPSVVSYSLVMSDEQEPSMTNITDNRLVSQNNRDDSLRINSLVDKQYVEPSRHQKYPTAYATNVVSSIAVNSQDHRRSFINDNDFDVFILDNFIRFTGDQNVVQWFDQTEHKFNELRIGQRLRFKAIPLLIEGVAKQKYVTHENPIRSFDNFYGFLLSQFDESDIDTNQCNCAHGAANYQPPNLPTLFKPRLNENSIPTDIHPSDKTELTRQTPALCSTSIVNVRAANTLGEIHAITLVTPPNNSQLLNLPIPFDLRSTDNSPSTDTHISDKIEFTRQTPVLCSTSIVDVSAADTFGEMHATTSVNSSTNVSVSDCDRTVNDLREDSVSNSIGNPKTFKDGTVAMQKWIEEIQHFLEVASIPDSTCVDLNSYSLRSDAFERFKTIDPAYSSFLTDLAREMFSCISYTRYNPLGYEASACSSL